MTSTTVATIQRTPAGSHDCEAACANNDGKSGEIVADNRDATCSTSGEPTATLLG